MKLQNKKGFTLIELLVVITIIGILATGAVATYTSQIQKARDTTRVNDIKAIQSGIEQLYQDNGTYPTENKDGFGTGGVGKYVERIPSDAKTTQACNKGNAATTTPCDYLYDVNSDANGVTYQNYNLSTGFENAGNVTAKADDDKDGGKMDNRLEIGAGIGSSTAYAGSGAITSGSGCSVHSNYMLIKGNCN